MIKALSLLVAGMLMVTALNATLIGATEGADSVEQQSESQKSNHLPLSPLM